MATKATKVDVIEILADFIEVYPGTKISARGLAKYADCLVEYNVEDVEKAMYSLLRKSRYFPTIADICEEIRGKKKYTPENGYI